MTHDTLLCQRVFSAKGRHSDQRTMMNLRRSFVDYTG